MRDVVVNQPLTEKVVLKVKLLLTISPGPISERSTVRETTLHWGALTLTYRTKFCQDAPSADTLNETW